MSPARSIKVEDLQVGLAGVMLEKETVLQWQVKFKKQKSYSKYLMFMKRRVVGVSKLCKQHEN